VEERDRVRWCQPCQQSKLSAKELVRELPIRGASGEPDGVRRSRALLRTRRSRGYPPGGGSLPGATTKEEVKPVAVQDVTVISVPVSDQQRAKAFYVETLGFELQREDDSIPGIRWVQVAPKAGTTALTLVTWFDSMPPAPCEGWCSAPATCRQTTSSWWPGGRVRRAHPSSSRGPPRRSCTTPTATAWSSSKPEANSAPTCGANPWWPAPHVAGGIAGRMRHGRLWSWT
jgi:hypothetical protein